MSLAENGSLNKGWDRWTICEGLCHRGLKNTVISLKVAFCRQWSPNEWRGTGGIANELICVPRDTIVSKVSRPFMPETVKTNDELTALRVRPAPSLPWPVTPLEPETAASVLAASSRSPRASPAFPVPSTCPPEPVRGLGREFLPGRLTRRRTHVPRWPLAPFSVRRLPFSLPHQLEDSCLE